MHDKATGRTVCYAEIAIDLTSDETALIIKALEQHAAYQRVKQQDDKSAESLIAKVKQRKSPWSEQPTTPKKAKRA